jgi:hypothetical protein
MEEREQWMNRFSNLWLAGENEETFVHSVEPVIEDLDPVIELEERSEVPAIGKPQIENFEDREEWLERFASLWLACGKDEVRFKLEVKRSNIFSGGTRHSSDVLSELGNGRVVIGDSLLHASEKNKNQLRDEDIGNKEFSPNPDDLVVVDIDPEIAIKLLTASRGVGL